MTKLRELIESATKIENDIDIIEEDGTVADLGAIPTGHIRDKKVDVGEVE